MSCVASRYLGAVVQGSRTLLVRIRLLRCAPFLSICYVPCVVMFCFSAASVLPCMHKGQPAERPADDISLQHSVNWLLAAIGSGKFLLCCGMAELMHADGRHDRAVKCRSPNFAVAATCGQRSARTMPDMPGMTGAPT